MKQGSRFAKETISVTHELKRASVGLKSLARLVLLATRSLMQIDPV